MSRKRRTRSEPRCARCGNEEDLAPWDNGALFCQPCTTCPHGASDDTVHGICCLCLRSAYTIWTFEGPRIRNLAKYWSEALRDYGITAYGLYYWTFDEQELAIQDALETSHVVRPERRAAPPHHRF